MVEQLFELSSSVKADDIAAKLKAIRENALRSLRDKSEIYEAGGNVIKLGPRHKFSVNKQDLDLTIIPRGESLYFHLSGTDYYELVVDTQLNELKDYWELNLESESKDVYRAEYLAAQIITDAKMHRNNLNFSKLSQAAMQTEEMFLVVREYATPRYKEGYEKGIHDHDAAKILIQLIPVIQSADLLRFDPTCRALAQIFWSNIRYPDRTAQEGDRGPLSYETWQERAQSAAQLESVFASSEATRLIVIEVQQEFSFVLQRACA